MVYMMSVARVISVLIFQLIKFVNLLVFKPRFMKRNVVMLMVFAALASASCRKESSITDLSESVQSNLLSDNASAIQIDGSKKKLWKSLTNFGAFITQPGDDDPYNFITDVATELGVSCLRDRTPVPGNKKVKLLTSDFNVLLNFSSTGEMPMSFRTDLNNYREDLENSLSALNETPLLAVIENEESNTKYFDGTPEQYISLLQVGIEVMHSHNIPVANGGITSVGLKYLVYQDYLSRGLITRSG